jgi:predicted 3-demethylubiquinone-9 3-methyltransferase (glyoxalase superfamily)
MPAITPFLWYDGQAEEAANLYTSIFPDSQIVEVQRWGPVGTSVPGGPVPPGTVMSATIRLRGQELILFNGGPMFKFSPAASLFVSCKTQEEVDRYWDQLSAGGEIQPCGWLKDKFGVSWQIIPDVLMELLHHQDAEISKRAMQAMLQMKKIDIAGLKRAVKGEKG